MQPDDDLFAVKFAVLVDDVSDHIEQEETQLFPALIKAHLDLSPLLEPMTARKEALLEQRAADY